MNKNKLNLKNDVVTDINKTEDQDKEKKHSIDETKIAEDAERDFNNTWVDAPATEAVKEAETVVNEAVVQENNIPVPVAVSQVKPVEVIIPNKTTTVTQNVPSEFEDRKSFIIQNGTNNEKSLINTLESYVKVMKPRAPIDPVKVGVVTQYGLYKTLEWLLESVPQHEFKGLFNIVIMYFKQYKTHCFAPEQVARFSEHWGYDKDELTAFLGLVDLLAGSVSETREVTVPKINFKNLFNYKKISEEAQQRISIFYSL